MKLTDFFVSLWKDIKIFYYKKFGKNYAGKCCTHRMKWVERVIIGGRGYLSELEDLDFCHECLRWTRIYCARCHKPIFAGDSITLYLRTSKTPAFARTCPHDMDQVIGCMRDECQAALANMMGHWVAPGKVRKVFSLFEFFTAPDEELILNDAGDLEW